MGCQLDFLQLQLSRRYEGLDYLLVNLQMKLHQDEA
jgi:hypothetical protein